MLAPSRFVGWHNWIALWSGGALKKLEVSKRVRIKVVRSGEREPNAQPAPKQASPEQIAQQNARQAADIIGGWIKEWRQKR